MTDKRFIKCYGLRQGINKIMKNFFLYNIGQKFLAGLTGLGLAGFVLVHMLGNMLIFSGPKAYNLYAHNLLQSSWFVPAELALLFCFVLHIVLVLFLSIKNYIARPIKYARKATGIKATALYQKTLLAQGAVVLVFVILHLIIFKYGEFYKVYYGGKAVRDLFRLVVEVFQNPWAVSWYCLALIILCFHLVHGVSSAFRSLGLDKAHWQVWVNRVSVCYGVLVVLGFLSQPIYVFFFLGVG